MISRISRYVRILSETVITSVVPPRVDDHKLKSALRPSVGFANLTAQLRDGSGTRFFVDPTAADVKTQLLQSDLPNTIPTLIARADAVCEHIFDVLGSGPTSLGNPMKWHEDFINHYRWPRRYYRLLKPAKYPGGYDIKVPWDLSECHHFLWLGQAYWITGDERYAREYVNQTTDWLSANPPYLGINWVSPMKVALRAANWLIALHLFRCSPSLSDEFLLNLLRSFLLHGRYLMANLEGNRAKEDTGNHYIANLTGLIYLGIGCPYFVEARSWLDFAVDELWSELSKQVFDDGMHHEASISYHRLVCEMFLYSAILCAQNGIVVPEFVNVRIQKMLDVIRLVTKPDGEVPLIGDSDNGRLHRFAGWTDPQKEWLDLRYLLAIGGTYFNRDDLSTAAGPKWEEAYWLLGESAKRARERILEEDVVPISSSALPIANIYVMRSRNLHVVINAGRKKGIGKLGHNHNDRLSFDFFAYGQSFIVDPGTYVYTRDFIARSQFRSTKQHNTIVVDGAEMSEYDDQRCFQMPDSVSTNVIHWESGEEWDCFAATHDGYQRLNDPVLHRRELYLNKMQSFVVVHDIFSGNAAHSYELSLQLRPLSIHAATELYGAYMIEGIAEARLLVVPLSLQDLDVAHSFSICEGQVSYSYGHRVNAPKICYAWRDVPPAKFSMVLVAVGIGESVEQRWSTVEEILNGADAPFSKLQLEKG